jgi:hypothetical protein
MWRHATAERQQHLQERSVTRRQGGRLNDRDVADTGTSMIALDGLETLQSGTERLSTSASLGPLARISLFSSGFLPVVADLPARTGT